MNVFVTGGTGFLGMHLTKFLARKGYNITIYDNFSNSIPPQYVDKNMRIIEGDLLNSAKVLDSMKDTDLVIHLAARISVKDSIKNPENTIKTNVTGTQNILESCLKNKISGVIAASTAAVFGDQTDALLTEESPRAPLSPYGKSKLLMEEMFSKFSKQHGLDFIILRFFNLYGTGQSTQYAGVITKFLEHIDCDTSLEIHGNGKQTRDFIHVDDAVSSIYLAIKNIHHRSGLTYNVGSGYQTSILELARLLIQLSKKDLQIIHKPPMKGDILHSYTSIRQIEHDLGFMPKITLESGLRRFFD